MPVNGQSGSFVGAGSHPDAEHLAEYLDGRLAPAERRAVEEHLASCEVCREAVGDAAAIGALEPAAVTELHSTVQRAPASRPWRWQAR